MTAPPYRLDDQVGFLLRRAHQRHTALFADRMPKQLTPTQFAALARLYEHGASSQNLLGRDIAVDAATMKGVVDRLGSKGLVAVAPDEKDGRRVTVSLTGDGVELAERCIPIAVEITEATLAPVPADQRGVLLDLLRALADGGELPSDD